MRTLYLGKERSVKIKVPLYGETLELVITSNMLKSQLSKSRRKRLGNWNPIDAAGLMCWRDFNFSIIMDIKYLSHTVIAHEIFHATHRILQYNGIKFRIEEHEAFAHLNGCLTELVYKQLNKWKIRIK